MIGTEWLRPEGKIKLGNNELHLWLLNINSFAKRINKLEKILNSDELKKAHKFVFEKDKDSYIISRSILRILLGSYLNILAENISFVFNDFGKPFISNSLDSNIKFNLSHSKDYCLIGVCECDHIGVDIEWVNKKLKFKEIASNYFSDEEVRNFKKVNEENLTKRFFELWTRKEAFIKAIGQGLSFPLTSFDISLDEHFPKISRIEGEFNIKKYHINNINVNSEYCAAAVNIGREKKKCKFYISDFSVLNNVHSGSII